MGIQLGLSGPWWAWFAVLAFVGVGAVVLAGAVAEIYLDGVKRAWEDRIKKMDQDMRFIEAMARRVAGGSNPDEAERRTRIDFEDGGSVLPLRPRNKEGDE